MSINIYKFGTEAMVAYGIGNKINSLITLPCNGVGSVTATILGQNMGAKQVYISIGNCETHFRNYSVVQLYYSIPACF